VRVQRIVVAAERWGMTREQIAAKYDLTLALVDEALAFYAAHRAEIDRAIEAQGEGEAQKVGTL
jgi:uncharacterized protein (DUF433 family)